MTTVACKWTGVGWQAAGDTLVSGYVASISGIRKIGKTPDGNLFGCAGDAGYAGKFISWGEDGFRNGWVIGKETDETVDHAFITYTVDGEPYVRIMEGNQIFDLRTPFFALGSGRSIALGAMAAGASVEEAVRIACTYDPNSGGDVVMLEHIGRIKLPEPIRGAQGVVAF